MDKWQRFILANARYAPKVLPFLVQAGFSLARRLGKEKFFTQVNGGSPGRHGNLCPPRGARGGAGRLGRLSGREMVGA
jgi:hypothetical protein